MWWFNKEEIVNAIKSGKYKYVFDTSENWNPNVLKEFSPCLIVDTFLAGWLVVEEYIVPYDSGSYDVSDTYYKGK